MFFLDDFPLSALPRLTHYGFASLDGRHGVENDCHFGYEFVYVEVGSANLVLNEFEAPLCIAGEDLIITPRPSSSAGSCSPLRVSKHPSWNMSNPVSV